MKLKVNPLLFVVVLTLANLAGFACLNERQPLKTVGEPFDQRFPGGKNFLKEFTSHRTREEWLTIEKEVLAAKSKKARIDYDNELAVALVHLGRVKEAIEILEKFEREVPGKYLTASNLGTAYELNGENDKALHWIREGVIRNPQSHFGTEWLHIKILEAKIALTKDPDWLTKNSVVGTDLSGADLTNSYAVDFQGNKKPPAEIGKALLYQLHERLEFVKPPDPTVADMLSDSARLFANGQEHEQAEGLRAMAVEYGWKQQTETPPAVVAQEELTKMPFWIYLVAGLLVIVGAMSVFLLFKKRPPLQ